LWYTSVRAHLVGDGEWFADVFNKDRNTSVSVALDNCCSVGVWRGFRVVILMGSFIVVWLSIDILKIYRCFNRDITAAVSLVLLSVRRKADVVGDLSKELLNLI